MGEALDLVKQCHADVAAFVAASDSDIEWISAREDPDHARHRGWDEIGRFFAHWIESYPDLNMNVLAWVRMTGTGSASGATLEMELAQVWTVRDGKVVRVEEFFDRDEAEAACRT